MKMAEQVISPRQLAQLFQLENQKFDQSQQRLGMLRSALNETIFAKEALNAISKSKKSEKMLVPLGAGIFADARIESTSEAVIMREGMAALPKKITEIEEELEKKTQGIEKAIENEMQENSRIFSNLNNLSLALRQAETGMLKQKKQA